MKDLYYKIPFDFKGLTKGQDIRKVTIEESLAQFISLIITTIFGEYKYDDGFGTVIWETDFNLLANANHKDFETYLYIQDMMFRYDILLLYPQILGYILYSRNMSV